MLLEWEDFDEVHAISFSPPEDQPAAITCAPARTRLRTAEEAPPKPPLPPREFIPPEHYDSNANDLAHSRFDKIRAVHNDTVGHHGINRTIRILHQQGIAWYRLAKDVHLLIGACAFCQKNRPPPQANLPETPLREFAAFEEISIDFIGPFPTDMLGNSFICSIMDDSTGYCDAEPCEAETAIVAAHCILRWGCRLGFPYRIRSDRGSQMTSEIYNELCRLCSIYPILTPPHHQQANGMK